MYYALGVRVKQKIEWYWWAIWAVAIIGLYFITHPAQLIQLIVY